MALDALAAAEGIVMSSSQCKAMVGKGRIAGRTVVLAKPQTFMNLSGDSVARRRPDLPACPAAAPPCAARGSGMRAQPPVAARRCR